MNSLQIESVVQRFSTLRNVFVGCYLNNTAPIHEINTMNELCFIMNTISQPTKMGHWILFYVKRNILYFFDSFGKHPDFYGGYISKIFKFFCGEKILVIQKELQMETSIVCGGYCILFALLMSKGHTIYYINSMFSFNKFCNDSIVKMFIYKVSRCVFDDANLNC